MKRALLATLSTLAGLVVLLGFKTTPLTTTASAATTTTSSSSAAAPGSTTTDRTDSATSTDGSASTAAQTVTGQAYGTRYGDVQVRVTVVDTQITDVTPVTLPSESPRDVQINAAATPVLEREALSAQSADIQMVSGATYTSQGYAASLQSALDQVPALADGQG